jgi:hypothetical protein
MEQAMVVNWSSERNERNERIGAGDGVLDETADARRMMGTFGRIR